MLKFEVNKACPIICKVAICTEFFQFGKSLIFSSPHQFQCSQDEENETTILAAEYAEKANMPGLASLLRNERPRTVQRKSSQEEQEENKGKNIEGDAKEDADRNDENNEQTIEEERVGE